MATCIVCNKKVLFKKTTPIGSMCKACFNKLKNQGIDETSLDFYNVDELKNKLLNQTPFVSQHQKKAIEIYLKNNQEKVISIKELRDQTNLDLQQAKELMEQVASMKMSDFIEYMSDDLNELAHKAVLETYGNKLLATKYLANDSFDLGLSLTAKQTVDLIEKQFNDPKVIAELEKLQN